MCTTYIRMYVISVGIIRTRLCRQFVTKHVGCCHVGCCHARKNVAMCFEVMIETLSMADSGTVQNVMSSSI